MTHQDIIDALEQLGKEHGAAYRAERERIETERGVLQRACGQLGHFFARHSDPLWSRAGRYCVFCQFPETSLKPEREA